MKAIADLGGLYTCSQQVSTIDANTSKSVIKVDFTEPGMPIPIYQVARGA